MVLPIFLKSDTLCLCPMPINLSVDQVKTRTDDRDLGKCVHAQFSQTHTWSILWPELWSALITSFIMFIFPDFINDTANRFCESLEINFALSCQHHDHQELDLYWFLWINRQQYHKARYHTFITTYASLRSPPATRIFRIFSWSALDTACLLYLNIL